MSTKIDAEVQTNSKKFEASMKENGAIRVKLVSKPEKNKANQELVEGLKKLLKANVLIVKGLKSRKKTLIVGETKENIKKRLES